MPSYVRTFLSLCALAVLTLGSACGVDPCEQLEQRVCKEKKDKARCKIMQDTQRREHLSGDACDAMLKALKR